MFYLIVGMLPAILLIIYIYKIDSVEKEPFPLLLSLFLLGGFSTIAASLLEEATGRNSISGLTRSFIPSRFLWVLPRLKMFFIL